MNGADIPSLLRSSIVGLLNQYAGVAALLSLLFTLRKPRTSPRVTRIGFWQSVTTLVTRIASVVVGLLMFFPACVLARRYHVESMEDFTEQYRRLIAALLRGGESDEPSPGGHDHRHQRLRPGHGLDEAMSSAKGESFPRRAHR